MPEPERPLTVTGVDGCAAGWVAVTLGSPVTGIGRDAHQP